jgi:hypothetical protein
VGGEQVSDIVANANLNDGNGDGVGISGGLAGSSLMSSILVNSSAASSPAFAEVRVDEASQMELETAAFNTATLVTVTETVAAMDVDTEDGGVYL